MVLLVQGVNEECIYGVDKCYHYTLALIYTLLLIVSYKPVMPTQFGLCIVVLRWAVVFHDKKAFFVGTERDLLACSHKGQNRVSMYLLRPNRNYVC